MVIVCAERYECSALKGGAHSPSGCLSPLPTERGCARRTGGGADDVMLGDGPTATLPLAPGRTATADSRVPTG